MSRHRIVWLLFFILCLLGFWLEGIFFFGSAVFLLNLLAFLAFFIYQSAVLSAEFFFPSICAGDPNKNAVALTFDDGPIPGFTDKILDILKEHQVQAAFFCIGNRIESNPALARRIIDEGHLIANHSYSHPKYFGALSAQKVFGELIKNDLVIESITGKKPLFFRPPFGVANPMIATALEKSKHLSIGWSVRSFDSIFSDPNKLLNRLMCAIKPGDIVLLHDYASSTMSMLPDLIQFLQNKDIQIQRLDVLIDQRPYPA